MEEVAHMSGVISRSWMILQHAVHITCTGYKVMGVLFSELNEILHGDPLSSKLLEQLHTYL